jgi:hypothetical protein
MARAVQVPWTVHPVTLSYGDPTPMHASLPPIHRKSRMRKGARTDLCGGRSVMIVPTATVIHFAGKRASRTYGFEDSFDE